MALPADFNKIYGSTATGGLTPISDVNYAKGWEFVGSNPPTKNDFSYLQNLSDRKSQWLYSNKLQRENPFGDIKSDGNVQTALANLGLGNLKYGAPMIGELVEWPRAEMPQEIWPDCGMEFIPYMAQSFDPVKYPLLAALHPANKLPADMRGYAPRGWDNGRGVDINRELMSEQGDAIRNITGSFVVDDTVGNSTKYPPSGAFYTSTKGVPYDAVSVSDATGYLLEFSAGKVVPVADENRMKNVAWNMIVRAK